MEDPHFEDRAYPDAPLAFRAWARDSRDTIRLILASDLGLSRKAQASSATKSDALAHPRGQSATK